MEGRKNLINIESGRVKRYGHHGWTSLANWHCPLVRVGLCLWPSLFLVLVEKPRKDMKIRHMSNFTFPVVL